MCGKPARKHESANETVSFTKKLATRRALAAGLEPAEEIRRWYAVIACAIQRTHATIRRGEPVPARAYPLRFRGQALQQGADTSRW